MNDIFALARFEFRYHLHRPAFYLFAAFVWVQGIWYAQSASSQFAGNDASALAYLSLASLGIILAVVSVLLAGQSLTKDIDYRTSPYLYTLPVTSRAFFAGRFLGTYLTVLTLAVFYPLGVGVYQLLMPLPGSGIAWLSLTDGFVRLLMVNAFIITCLAFSLTVLLRGIQGAYLVLFITVLYFLLNETDAPLTTADLWLLLDPFGVGMVRESATLLHLGDDTTGLLVFSDMLFINRLLWVGLSLGLLAWAEETFSFQTFGLTRPKKPKLESALTSQPMWVTLPTVQLNFSLAARWQTGLRLAWLHFLTLIRQPFFLITAGLLVLIAMLLATVFGKNPDFPTLPLTAQMTALRIPMQTLIGLFLIVATGELFFQERTVGFQAIYDVLPQPTTVRILSKLLTMSGIAALLTLVLFLTGVGIQVVNGTAIDWHRYAADLLLDGWLRYIQLVTLAGFVAAIVNNRLVSHVISSLIFLGLSVSYLIAPQARWIGLYSFLPGSAQYSDLIGYGANEHLRLPVHLLWWGVASLFVTLTLLMAHRGADTNLAGRVRLWQRQFSPAYAQALLAFVLLTGVCVWQIGEQFTKPLRVYQSNGMTTQTMNVSLASGRVLPVAFTWHHPYQVQNLSRTLRESIATGERLFGSFPYASLHLTETPASKTPVQSAPGQLFISEDQGWTADNRHPDQLDYLDYRLTRDVFNQWLVHRLRPAPLPGDGFLRNSLAEYMALRVVAEKYGAMRLSERLAQRSQVYQRYRARTDHPEPSLLQVSDNPALTNDRAALMLNSIAEVWGDAPVSLTIGQFYRRAVQQPGSATAVGFARQMRHNLPDSLRYLTTYLSQPLWFDFRVGRVANLSSGLTVEVLAKKWREPEPGHRQKVLINDYVPLAVLDKAGREIYRTLVHPDPNNPVHLPALPNARSVVIDPLGAWPEENRRNNQKLL